MTEKEPRADASNIAHVENLFSIDIIVKLKCFFHRRCHHVIVPREGVPQLASPARTLMIPVRQTERWKRKRKKEKERKRERKKERERE